MPSMSRVSATRSSTRSGAIAMLSGPKLDAGVDALEQAAPGREVLGEDRLAHDRGRPVERLVHEAGLPPPAPAGVGTRGQAALARPYCMLIAIEIWWHPKLWPAAVVSGFRTP